MHGIFHSIRFNKISPNFKIKNRLLDNVLLPILVHMPKLKLTPPSKHPIDYTIIFPIPK